MALSQSEWYEKLKSFVPTWFFAEEQVNVALFQAIAKVLHDKQEEVEAAIVDSYIQQTSGSYLDLHGSERSVHRSTGETDGDYADRIVNIRNSTSLPTLYQAVTDVLNNGLPTFIENWSYGFFDDELFFDVDDCIILSKTKLYNRFTVIIPIQTGGDESEIKELIVSVLDYNKALGVFYDVIYRTV